jgi:type II secretory pathway component PulF
VLYALSETQQWSLLMDVISGLPEQTQQSLLSRSRELDRDMCIQMIVAADKAGRVDSALKRIAELPAAERQRYQALLKILPEAQQTSLIKRSESLGLSVLIPST